MLATFWGTRGSIPTAHRSHLTFGGNTSCVEIQEGKNRLILDAGTGIRPLGLSLSEGADRSYTILISHTHMDHIGGLPFFAPALKIGNRIAVYGPPGLKKVVSHLFPFPALPAKKKVVEIGTKKKRIGSFQVTPYRLNHPGPTYGYRVQSKSGKVVVYMSDHEDPSRFSHHKKGKLDQEMERWAFKADLLILDSQYFTKEYRKKRGWGHSHLSDSLKFAKRSDAKQVVLFHHDPGHTDAILLKKLKQAKRIMKREKMRFRCFLAEEGKSIRLSS